MKRKEISKAKRIIARAVKKRATKGEKMKVRGMRFKVERFLLAGVMAVSLGLSGCLPGSESVDDAQDFTRLESESQFMASDISQFALQVQNAVTNSTAWQTLNLPQGAFANLTVAEQQALGVDNLRDSGLAAGYCDLDTAADTENNTFFAWFDSTDSNGDFVAKGLGREASGRIMSALSGITSPDTIAVSDGNGTLRRGDGTTLALPAGCALGIPNGAPVVMFENIQRQTTQTGEEIITLVEFETQDCPQGEIGLITERVTQNFDPVAGTKTEVSRNLVSNTCGTQGQEMVVNSGNSTATFDIVTQDVVAAAQGSAFFAPLTTLNQVKCRAPQEGQAQDDNSTEITTCTDEGGNPVGLLEGIEDPTETGQFVATQINKACSPGDTASTFVVNINGIATSASPVTGWQTKPGTDGAVFERNFQEWELTQGSVTGDTGQRQKWLGLSLNCERVETAHIACSDMFPAQASDPNLVAVNNGGVTYSRTNEVDGWADPANLIPNNPTDPEWQMDSIDCAWQEQQTFSHCSPGWSNAQMGIIARTITANAPGNVIIPASFNPVQDSVCTSTSTSGSPCPAAPQPVDDSDVP